MKFQNKTTGIINLKLQDYLRNTQVYLPSLDEQKRIVKIMDKVFSIIIVIGVLDEIQKILKSKKGNYQNLKNWVNAYFSKCLEILFWMKKMEYF